LHDLALDEDQISVLGTYSRPGLEIELKRCRITGAAAVALAQALGRNQGPTKLVNCYMDICVLVNGLRGNSRLKSLTPRTPSHRDDLAIAGALKENEGLVDLHIWYYFGNCDETWGAICDSLTTHQTLEVLEIWHLVVNPSSVPPSVITSRVQALVDMLKGNMLIHTIRVNDHYREHELFRGSVIPHLESNRLRPRLLAIQKTRPIMYRAKVLGRALLAVRTDPNRFWMLLSRNPDVAFRRRLRRPRQLRTSLRLILLPLLQILLLLLLSLLPMAATTVAAASTTGTSPTGAVVPLPLSIVRSARSVLSPTRDINFKDPFTK
jgi:hypothetical protein